MCFPWNYVWGGGGPIPYSPFPIPIWAFMRQTYSNSAPHSGHIGADKGTVAPHW